MSFDKALRVIAVWAIIAAVFVPLYVSESLFFPFISGKNFAFRIFAEIAFAAWLILAFRNPEYRPRRSALLWSILFFVATLGISTLLAEDPSKSFWSNFERMEGLVGIIHFAFYFVVAGAVFSASDWRRLVAISLCVNAVIMGYAFLQFFGVFAINQGGVRVDATFGNAIYLGVYALFHLFFASAAALWARRERKHTAFVFLFVVLALGNIVLIMLSATRGVILGLFVGVVVGSVVASFSHTASTRVRRLGIIGIALALFSIGGFFVARQVPQLRNHTVFSRILSASSMNEDAQARFIIWGISWKGFKERPLFGWGQEGFNFVFNKHYDPRLYGREAWFDRAHNAYLDWLIAGGILGFLGYLALWFFAGLFVLRGKNSRGEPLFGHPERALFAGFGVAYAVNNIFVFDNGVSHFLFLMLLAYVYSRATEEAVPMFGLRICAPKNALARAYAPTVFILLALSIYWFNVRPIYAGALLLDALRAQKAGPSENFELFKHALSLGTFANAEIREQLTQVTTAVAPIPSVPLAVKQEFFNTAVSELDKEIKKRPADARYYTFMGSLLDSFGLYEHGFSYWREASARSPRKQALLFQLGSNRLNAGTVKEAVSYFKQAYGIYPENRDAVIIYAVGLIYAGDRAEEKKVLATPSYIDGLPVDPRLIAAYEANGRTNDIVALWRAQLAREPNNEAIKARINELLAKNK